MATPLSAQQEVDALRAEGLAVLEFQNWRTHNRNHVGPFGPVHGVVIHHTVSSADDASVSLCYNGHSSLPGPLCHGVGRNDGRISLVGHGRANHAGLGDDDVLRAVIDETALPADNEANTDGNRYFYGLEIVNLGNGTDTYPWKQYTGAVKWATAYCRKHGWSEKSVIGHKEWQPGKIDPLGPVIGPDGKTFEFTMSRFRADVKSALAAPAGVWPSHQKEDEMNSEQEAKLDDVIKKVNFLIDNRKVAAWQYENPATSMGDRDALQVLLDAADADVLARVEGKLNSLAVGGVDLDALAEKVADLLAARLAD